MQLTHSAVLAGILAATETDRMPRVCGVHEVHGVTVTIVEPCITRRDRTDRGYLWHAVTGPFTLVASYMIEEGEAPGYEDESGWATSVPGGAFDGELLATSGLSPAACLRNAKAVLSARLAAGKALTMLSEV